MKLSKRREFATIAMKKKKKNNKNINKRITFNRLINYSFNVIA